MFDYDAWLEAPYTDPEFECNDECPVCWFECDQCDLTGELDNEKCSKCEGNGGWHEQQSKSEHDDYYADDSRDDD